MSEDLIVKKKLDLYLSIENFFKSCAIELNQEYIEFISLKIDELKSIILNLESINNGIIQQSIPDRKHLPDPSSLSLKQLPKEYSSTYTPNKNINYKNCELLIKLLNNNNLETSSEVTINDFKENYVKKDINNILLDKILENTITISKDEEEINIHKTDNLDILKLTEDTERALKNLEIIFEFAIDNYIKENPKLSKEQLESIDEIGEMIWDIDFNFTEQQINSIDIKNKDMFTNNSKSKLRWKNKNLPCAKDIKELKYIIAATIKNFPDFIRIYYDKLKLLIDKSWDIYLLLIQSTIGFKENQTQWLSKKDFLRILISSKYEFRNLNDFLNSQTNIFLEINSVIKQGAWKEFKNDFLNDKEIEIYKVNNVIDKIYKSIDNREEYTIYKKLSYIYRRISQELISSIVKEKGKKKLNQEVNKIKNEESYLLYTDIFYSELNESINKIKEKMNNESAYLLFKFLEGIIIFLRDKNENEFENEFEKTKAKLLIAEFDQLQKLVNSNDINNKYEDYLSFIKSQSRYKDYVKIFEQPICEGDDLNSNKFEILEVSSGDVKIGAKKNLITESNQWGWVIINTNFNIIQGCLYNTVYLIETAKKILLNKIFNSNSNDTICVFKGFYNQNIFNMYKEEYSKKNNQEKVQIKNNDNSVKVLQFTFDNVNDDISETKKVFIKYLELDKEKNETIDNFSGNINNKIDTKRTSYEWMNRIIAYYAKFSGEYVYYIKNKVLEKREDWLPNYKKLIEKKLIEERTIDEYILLDKLLRVVEEDGEFFVKFKDDIDDKNFKNIMHGLISKSKEHSILHEEIVVSKNELQDIRIVDNKESVPYLADKCREKLQEFKEEYLNLKNRKKGIFDELDFVYNEISWLIKKTVLNLVIFLTPAIYITLFSTICAVSPFWFLLTCIFNIIYKTLFYNSVVGYLPIVKMFVYHIIYEILFSIVIASFVLLKKTIINTIKILGYTILYIIGNFIYLTVSYTLLNHKLKFLDMFRDTPRETNSLLEREYPFKDTGVKFDATYIYNQVIEGIENINNITNIQKKIENNKNVKKEIIKIIENKEKNIKKKLNNLPENTYIEVKIQMKYLKNLELLMEYQEEYYRYLIEKINDKKAIDHFYKLNIDIYVDIDEVIDRKNISKTYDLEGDITLRRLMKTMMLNNEIQGIKESDTIIEQITYLLRNNNQTLVDLQIKEIIETEELLKNNIFTIVRKKNKQINNDLKDEIETRENEMTEYYYNQPNNALDLKLNSEFKE